MDSQVRGLVWERSLAPCTEWWQAEPNETNL